MTKSKSWELPIDDETKKLGKFSRVKVKGSEMHIYNGKARKPMCTFPYNGNDLYDTIEVKCRAALVEVGYADDLITRLCRRLINALDEYVKTQAQKQYESGDEGSTEDNKLKPLYLLKYTKGIPHGIPIAESIILGDTKPRWLQIVDGKAKLSKEIVMADGRPLRPWDIGNFERSQLSREYEFSDEDEINSYIVRAQNENLDTLYNRSIGFWKKYIDADNYHHVICTALQTMPEHSETPRVAENGNNCNCVVENTQDAVKNVENIITQTSDKDVRTLPQASEASGLPLNGCLTIIDQSGLTKFGFNHPLQKNVTSDIDIIKPNSNISGAPEAPEAPKMSHLSKEAQNEEISNHQLELSQSSESSQTTTLPSFGINNPLEKDITSDTGTDQQTAEVSSDSQVLPTHRIKPKTDELLTSSTSEEWQKFSKMEDDERQSGQFLHVSVPRKKFHEAIESSGIAVGDIPQIIKDMNLETVCIEKDGQYIYCYRRKGE